jgi:outer membrane protein assembly factor BamA
MRYALLVFFSLAIFSARGNAEIAVDDTLPVGIKSKFLVFPFFLRSPETDWGFGAAGAYFFKSDINNKDSRTSDVNLISLYTLKKQVVIVLGSTIFFKDERQIFRFQSSFSYYPDKFWGIGNDSPESAKEDFSLKQFFINPQLLLRMYRKFLIGASIEYQSVTDFDYRSGSIFDTDNVQGRFGGHTSGVGILATWDTRNNAYSPGKGTFAELNATRFDKMLGSDFDFITYIIDFRKFFPFGRNRVLASQIFLKYNVGDTPIRNLSLLGGPEMMRGYYKGRYADRNLISFQAEVRQYLFWRLGVTAFASAGQVTGEKSNFGANNFHLAGGAGIRIMVQEKEKLNLRVDFGYAENSHGVYVILKEAF